MNITIFIFMYLLRRELYDLIIYYIFIPPSFTRWIPNFDTFYGMPKELSYKEIVQYVFAQLFKIKH